MDTLSIIASLPAPIQNLLGAFIIITAVSLAFKWDDWHRHR